MTETAKEEYLAEFVKTVRGWIAWYETGGGAGKALKGIKEALPAEEKP